MTQNYIDIDGYWGVVICYDLRRLDEYEIRQNLMSVGMKGPRIDEAVDILLYEKNTGLCVSVPSKRMSVCFIGNTTSDDQFMDTLAHELYHVHSAICEYYDVPTDGEDAAWTMGFLMRQAVKMITSKYMPTATPRAWA